VKSFINKIFGSEQEKPSDPDGPSAHWPIPVSVDDLHQNQQRAITGWIANRMGQRLQQDKSETGALIYVAFTKETFHHNKQDDGEYLIYLASCLVQWVYEHQDIYLKIRDMKLPDKYHVSFLEVYEEIKEQIGRYLPDRSHASKHSAPDKHDEVWQIYRDVIFAATQGKFLLIGKREVDGYKLGALLCESDIRERPDIPKARDLAKQALSLMGISQTVVMSRLLIISEAITNILKHAQDGKMSIYETVSTLNVVVEDRGPGFPLKLLPNTVLMAGYSTKKSLGQGFTLMLKMTEKVILSTTPGEGSTLILVFKREEGEKNIGLGKA
jgi:anti-sigma regulatory factor (Ser/Thr protein kinase)